MNYTIIIINLIGLIAIAFLIIFLINKKLAKPNQDQDQKLLLDLISGLRQEINNTSSQSRKELQDRLDKINDRLNKGLEDSTQNIQKQFAQSMHIVKDVTEKLSKLDETNKQILDFSGQLQSLENVLKNPKQRGILGEYYLEKLLSQVLTPNQFKLQYEFKNHEKVDAAIFLGNQIIPIDAKFSLEKYNLIMVEKNKDKREQLEKQFKSDIKNRIDETAKYIRPAENTTDFAIMFIPAEGIFYNLLLYKTGTIASLNTQDLIEYAFKKKVMITSPTSFFAYLQTILQGLKALKIEESVKEIIKRTQELDRHLKAYEVYYQKLGKNLGTTVNMYNCGYKELGKIDKDVYKITDGKSGGQVELISVDKPQIEE